MNKNQIQEEALVQAKDYRHKTYALSVGLGKTFLALKDIVSKSDVKKIAVVAPLVSIHDNWRKEIELFDPHGDYPHLRDIVYVSYRYLTKAVDLDVDLIVFDEVHNIRENHIKFLNINNSKYYIGLTGTPPNDVKSKKYGIINLYFPIKYEFLLSDALDAEMLNDVKIVLHYVNLSTENDITVKTKTSYFKTSEKKSYEYITNKIEQLKSEGGSKKDLQFNAIRRMSLLKSFKSKLDYAIKFLNTQSEQFLVFANTKEQCDAITSNVYYSGNKASESNLQKFVNGDEKILASVQQLKEGVTIPNLKNGLILHAYGNEFQLTQKIGRFVRLVRPQIAEIHILVYKNTQDEKWCLDSLNTLLDKIEIYAGT